VRGTRMELAKQDIGRIKENPGEVLAQDHGQRRFLCRESPAR
jgi:hypothetical protein